MGTPTSLHPRDQRFDPHFVTFLSSFLCTNSFHAFTRLICFHIHGLSLTFMAIHMLIFPLLVMLQHRVVFKGKFICLFSELQQSYFNFAIFFFVYFLALLHHYPIVSYPSSPYLTYFDRAFIVRLGFSIMLYISCNCTHCRGLGTYSCL